LGQIAIENNLLIISDDIHCDIIYKGKKYIPFASLSQEHANISFTCTSISKTFNLAGLQVSNIIIPNSTLRSKWADAWKRSGYWGPNSFAPVALEAAYNQSESWLDDVLEYISHNYRYLKSFLSRHLPQVRVIEPDGTFLVWIDFRQLGLDYKELENVMIHKAKLALDEGYIFGEEGRGFERVNIACPRSILHEALVRLSVAFKERAFSGDIM